ncbi:Uncharacterised protein [Nocardia farcinica]|uniref:hypothetical protein n=1 Tax=Nocardia farcinica TaxID=37329 RepID=UPI000DF8F41B|nr:hypothetical protein [Nocardia farcinica]SUE29613.1 Uncharacterised protein [Nocardia farcinica]
MDLDDILRSAIENQPWWRKYANTVTQAYWVLIYLAWIAISLGIDLPAQVVWAVVAVLGFGNLMDIKSTKNGVTDSVAEQIKSNVEEYVGKHRRAE